MGATDADRARRYRRHKAGDHSLCLPGRCDALDAAPETVTPAADVTNVTGERDVTQFGPRGQLLWDELTRDGAPDPAKRVLLEETCRLADRLERLNAILTGDLDGWVDLRDRKGNGDALEIVINPLLAEARQQQMALRALVAELRQGKAAPAGTGVSVLDQLAARRAARRAGAAG